MWGTRGGREQEERYTLDKNVVNRIWIPHPPFVYSHPTLLSPYGGSSHTYLDKQIPRRTFTQMENVMTEEEIAMVAAWEEQEWGRLEMGYPFVYSGDK